MEKSPAIIEPLVLASLLYKNAQSNECGFIPTDIGLVKPSKNNTGAIYLIASGGSTSTGMEIIGPDRLEFEFDPTDYYLISDTAGQAVEIVEVE